MTLEDSSVPPTVVGSTYSSHPNDQSSQPQSSVDNSYGFDTGGIVSYVVPTPDSELNVVDALDVVPEQQILEKDVKKKRLFFVGGIFLIVVIALVIMSVVVTTTRRRGSKGSGTPQDTGTSLNSVSMAPTVSPSVSDTVENTAVGEFLLTLKRLYDDGEQFEGLFSDASSPQYRAAVWTVESSSEIDDPDRMIQRFALSTFYFATNGDDWVRCGRDSKKCDLSQEWLTEENECNWYAIECDEDGDVIKVFFPANGESSNNIRGMLPFELSFLSKLAVFIIARGPMSGPFPDWSKLSTLEQVLLNDNDFEGPFPTYLLSNNPLMGTIQFNRNSFEGPFLHDLLSVNSTLGVTNIDVNGNNLTGSIPSQINKFSALKLLDIGSNGFTGALPEELYELTNLVSLNVSDTNIRGEISSGIGAMSNLFHLYAGSTGMGGSLPTELFSLIQLQKLDLSVANFTGTLSESFSNLTNLDLIKLDHNKFNGTIPLGLENLPFLEILELENNEITGSVPQELCDRRGGGFMELQALTVDCLGESPEVSCQCCTNCPLDI